MAATSQRRWMRSITRPLWGHFREVLVISLFVNLLALAAPVFTLQVYDRVVFYSGLTTLQGLTIGMVVVLAFDFVLRQSRARLLQRVALRIDVEVGRRLFNKLLAVPLRTLESRPAAFWQSLFRDLEIIRNAYSGASAVLVADLPFAVLFLVMVYVLAEPIAWVFPLVLFCFAALAWRSGSAVDDATQVEREAAMARDLLMTELIMGRATVKALALSDSMRAQWESRHAETIRQSLRRGVKTDAYVNLGISLTVLTTVILTAVGALAIVEQKLTMGALIATNMLSARILSSFNQLFMSWRGFVMCRQAMAKLGEVFAMAEDRARSEVRLERPQGEITLDNVRFHYGDEQKPVIDGIKLQIKPNGLHAFVGKNGSGKTTLLKLIQGLYQPTSGRVLLDGADIAQFSREDLARWIGYVPQDGILFSGTIRDNIAKGKPGATDEEIVVAARMAGAHGFVIDLSDGYATQIGEGGGRLSGGQRQRLAIARALVGDPSVLLFDEPSNNLDRQVEDDLRASLVTLARNHTVILVTHSTALLPACNNVIVVEAGRVSMAGPTEDVLARIAQNRPTPLAVARNA
ncbi:MAG: ATP-binding cassette domain-containing protein [Rhodospirillaceae bacterium]|nr:ATP-binding cassette domain-containing protein [Rhodospirillaceae bacterium]